MDNELFYEYADLVRKYKSGDEEAFSELYDRSSRFVYMTCLNTLGNPEDAQDAMQETYLTVVNDIGNLEDEEKFLGWIKKIAVYKSIDIQRKRRDGISYDDAIETEEILEGDDDLESLPEYFIEEKAKREELHKIIKNVLSEDQYQTVLFYYFNEMSVKEIADVTGCPEGTIKRRLQNSRIKIKSGVEKYEKKTGDKLGAAAIGISFLGRFFKEEALGLHVPDISSLALSAGGTLPHPTTNAVVEAVEKAGETTEKAAEATAETLKPAASAVQKSSEATSATGRAAANVGRAAKTSFLATTGGKIAIGAVSLAVLVAAGIGVKALIDNNNRDVDDEEEVLETSVQTTETTQPLTSTQSEPAPSEITETTVDMTDPYQATDTADVTDCYSAPDTGWASAYCDVVMNINIANISPYYQEDMTSDQIKCDLVFINDDQIPELIISYTNSYDETLIEIYSYVNGAAVFVDDFNYSKFALKYIPGGNKLQTNGSLYLNGPDIVKSIAAYSMTDDGTAFTYITGYNSTFDITLDTITDADVSDDYDRYFTYTSETGYVEVPELEYNALFVDGDFQELTAEYSIYDFLNKLPIETPPADQIPNYFPAPTPTPKPASGNDVVMPA